MLRSSFPKMQFETIEEIAHKTSQLYQESLKSDIDEKDQTDLINNVLSMTDGDFFIYLTLLIKLMSKTTFDSFMGQIMTQSQFNELNHKLNDAIDFAKRRMENDFSASQYYASQDARSRFSDFNKENVYIKESTIPGIGKGLFAKKEIKQNEIIAFFTGTVKRITDHTKDQRSNIFLGNGLVLECDADNEATFCNDLILFPKEKRELITLIETDKPFYTKLHGSQISAELTMEHLPDGKCIFLKAVCDINRDSEIFCHYGFGFWFVTEIKRGFIIDRERKAYDPFKNIHQLASFTSYLNEFYPGYTKLETKFDPERNATSIKITFANGRDFVMPMENYYDKYLTMII